MTMRPAGCLRRGAAFGPSIDPHEPSLDPHESHAGVGDRTRSCRVRGGPLPPAPSPLRGVGENFGASSNVGRDTPRGRHLHPLRRRPVPVFWAFEIPLAYVLAVKLGMGPSGAFWAITIAFSSLAIVSGLIFRRGRWKSKVL